MKTNILIAVFVATIVYCHAAAISSDSSKSDLDTSASDTAPLVPAFLIGRNGYDYRNYPGGLYGNRGYSPNSVYRGYQTGLRESLGGGTSNWGYGDTGYRENSYSPEYGSYEDGFIGRPRYNSYWNNLGGYNGYNDGIGYYPGINRRYDGYGSYPSGYRGYV